MHVYDDELVTNEEGLPVKLYHQFLLTSITTKPDKSFEKSLVFFFSPLLDRESFDCDVKSAFDLNRQFLDNDLDEFRLGAG